MQALSVAAAAILVMPGLNAEISGRCSTLRYAIVEAKSPWWESLAGVREGVLIGRWPLLGSPQQERPSKWTIQPSSMCGQVHSSEAIDIEPSRTQPIALHKTLKGEAEVGSYEEPDIVLVGNSAGSMESTSGWLPTMCRRYDLHFRIDQSYLPAVIQPSFRRPISR